MVFQQPNPFPMSVFDNVAYALRQQGSRTVAAGASPAVEDALQRAGLWDEVHTKLSIRPCGFPAASSSACASRARSRPGRRCCCSTSPARHSTRARPKTIEELIMKLREEVAVVIVTHNLQQAHRVADRVAFMYLGELVESGPVEQIFAAPHQQRTRDYVSGAFGSGSRAIGLLLRLAGACRGPPPGGVRVDAGPQPASSSAEGKGLLAEEGIKVSHGRTRDVRCLPLTSFRTRTGPPRPREAEERLQAHALAVADHDRRAGRPQAQRLPQRSSRGSSRPSRTSPLLRPGETVVWVNDQVPRPRRRRGPWSRRWAQARR